MLVGTRVLLLRRARSLQVPELRERSGRPGRMGALLDDPERRAGWAAGLPAGAWRGNQPVFARL